MQQNNVITSIEELDKSRVKVYIDEQFAFVLYKGELRSMGLKQNSAITEHQLFQITSEILPKRAKKRAMNLLQKRQYTEKQLRDKLKQGLYQEEVIDDAVKYVKSFHYIDDLRFASDYIIYYSDYRSRGRIENDLIKKGIDRDVILKAYALTEEKDNLTDEQDLIRKELEKKHFHIDEADFTQKQKIIGYLYRKGFRLENIRNVIDDVDEL
ncbi:MAG: regulatory protein RecX [Lachnospiraceae bacterium]